MAGYIGSKAVITSGVSASIDELNIIDGVTATTAELNILDGVTSTAAELNILDGVTSTAAELNILDGVTATATELNLIDGVTATTAELNILDGVTATAAEINLIDGGTSRGTTAIADGDGVLINDAGTMRQTSVETLATYMGTKGLGPAYTRSATPPSSPNAGDWWVDTARSSKIYIYDGTLGWINFGDTTEYSVNGNFTIIVSNYGVIYRVNFQGASVGSTEVAETARGAGIPAFPTGTFNGDGFGLSNSVRGVYGRVSGSAQDHLSFLTMATDAASQDFGNLHAATEKPKSTTSHETRGLIAGGRLADATIINVIDYITIASAGNATDFGNLSVARHTFTQNAMSSTTRSIFAGGNTGSRSDVMDYVTIGSTGNATDFGNLLAVMDMGTTVNSTTRGIVSGGHAASAQNVIQYVTIGTTGNATDFGDLNGTTQSRNGFHSSTIAYLRGGVDQITMATAANATASGYSMIGEVLNFACMPGWIAYNG